MSQLLQEFCSSRGVALRIDRDAGLLRGVKLLGLASKNGREYPETTLARAASLYEGAKVNLNHPKGHPLAPRDYQDRLGTIRNVAARPGEGLFGDLQFNPKHALAEQLLWDAEHAPENVGFSHNVQARTGKRGDQTIVEEILAVQSVDLVADPATTRGLFESAALNDEAEVKRGDEETGRRGDSIANSSDNSSPLPVSESPSLPVSNSLPVSSSPGLPVLNSPPLAELSDQTAEIQRLREEINQLQAAQAIAEKRAAIAALLVEHGLPPIDGRGTAAAAITSDSFLQSLFTAPDEAALRILIRERAALVEQARQWTRDAAINRPGPVSREQTLVESRRDDSIEAFLKAIRA
ncbi:MAG: hypothetical protein WD894_24750 [Pirellulales bacterium]